MHPIKSQVHPVVSDLIFSYSGWDIIAPVPALSFSGLKDVERDYLRKLGQKKILHFSDFSTLVVMSYVLFIYFFNLNFQASVPVEAFIVLCIPCQFSS